MIKLLPAHLPKELTSYDLLKTFAVLLMLLDHGAAYFYPDEAWLRVIGRFCVPMWFFLIGYAGSRSLGKGLWIGGLLLILSDLLFGFRVLPLNILFTIIFVRIFLNPFMQMVYSSKFFFWMGCLGLLVLSIPTARIVDYGTMGFILAIFGYLVRHQEDIPQGQGLLYPYAMFSIIIFTFHQWMWFGFSGAQGLALFAGTGLVILSLYAFRPAIYKKTSEILPAVMVNLLQLTGRRTLEIYVLQFFVFKYLAHIVRPELYPDPLWFGFL